MKGGENGGDVSVERGFVSRGAAAAVSRTYVVAIVQSMTPVADTE